MLLAGAVQKYPKFTTMRMLCSSASVPVRPFFLLPFLLLFLLCSALDLQAQRRQRFKAGVIAGITAAQIDGDASAGYNKVGLQGGLRGIVL